MLEQLQKANPQLPIRTTRDESFSRYAMPVEAGAVEGLFSLMDAGTEIPGEGNVYIASDSRFEQGEEFRRLQEGYYGGMPMQIGYCNGNNQYLNALEYHRGCEVTLAITDLVLLLAHFADIREGKLDSGKVNAYYVSKGEAFALFESTLHFSPCAALDTGFKAAIILPQETNTPLETRPEPVFWQDRLLFMRNKWLLAHSDSVQAREKGAYVGITGENLRVVPVQG